MCLRCISRVRRWKFLSLLALIVAVAFMRAVWSSLRPDPLMLSDLEKCPLCYGLSICDDIAKGKLKVTPFDVNSALSHILRSKNVFSATMGKKRVVLKKLAHSWELNALDEFICGNGSLVGLCPEHGKTKYTGNVDFRSLTAKAVTSRLLAPEASSLMLCPNADHLDKLLENVFDNGKDRDYVYLWTLVNVNPEPLVLQILPAAEGWPVPRYYGACGRLVAVEYIGPLLSSYHYEPWIRRARIASSLLNAARMFTYGSPDFGFYLTDVSPDNIAVTAEDQAKFVDLEHIIIVDKNVSFKGMSGIPSAGHRSEAWERVQTNDENVECRNCLAFNPDDICDHRISDHNYYAICQHILSDRTTATALPGGFLHSVPITILNRYSGLLELLDQCAVPSTFRHYDGTFYGDKLKDILDRIIKDTG